MITWKKYKCIITERAWKFNKQHENDNIEHVKIIETLENIKKNVTLIGCITRI